MKNKNNVFLMLLAIATLLTAVVGATYAYFASVTDGTGVSTDLDVEAQANTAQFTAEGGTFGFTVTGADMMQSNAGSLAKESTGSLEVNLTSPKLALCTFDVKFAWNEGSSYTPTATLADGVTEFGVLYEGNSYGAVNNAAKVINFDKLLNNYDGIVLDQAKIAILESDGTEKTETINLNFKVQMYNLNHDQSALAGGSSKSYNGKFYIDNVECTETKLPLNDVILASNEIYPDNIASPYVTNAIGIDFGQVSSDTNGKGVYYTNENTENNDYTFYFRGDVDNNNVQFGEKAAVYSAYACRYNGKIVAGTDEYDYYRLTGDATESQCGGPVCEYDEQAEYYINDYQSSYYKYSIGGCDERYSGKIIEGSNAEWTSILVSPAKPYYWKIVRINEDDSIKLIYNGTGDTTTNSDGDVLLNNVTQSSPAEWYNSYFVNYQDYLQKGIYYSDSVYYEGSYQEGVDYTVYSVYNRIHELKTPMFNYGGRKESYFGILTADEAMYAGATETGNSYNYLTGGPQFVSSLVRKEYDADVYYVVSEGGQLLTKMYYIGDTVSPTRPIINLKPNTKILSGNGTETNPYQIILD